MEFGRWRKEVVVEAVRVVQMGWLIIEPCVMLKPYVALVIGGHASKIKQWWSHTCMHNIYYHHHHHDGTDHMSPSRIHSFTQIKRVNIIIDRSMQAKKNHLEMAMMMIKLQVVVGDIRVLEAVMALAAAEEFIREAHITAHTANYLVIHHSWFFLLLLLLLLWFN